MDKIIINVKDCSDCPFLNDTIGFCSLEYDYSGNDIKHINIDDIIPKWDWKEGRITPDWCRLKNGVEIQLKTK